MRLEAMNKTPKGERYHIALFGKRNAGKSSVMNAITGQEISIVSSMKGTTTDPVCKAMEFLPIGPVMVIDTPGLDDEGALGELRVKKTEEILEKTDLALIVVDGTQAKDTKLEKGLEQRCKEKGIQVLWVFNKKDLCKTQMENTDASFWVSAKNKEGIEQLKEFIGKSVPVKEERPIVRDLLQRGDVVLLVVPIDKAAPKGRLILPQQQVIRDVLEAGAFPILVRDLELEMFYNNLKEQPKLVITDSQVFEMVSRIVPDDVLLTSFSILMARYKGNLKKLANEVGRMEELQDGDCILMAEGCTHHRQCGDIGTQKIPNWIKKYTGKNLQFDFSSGTQYPTDLEKYKMIVHCGGCMITQKEMQYRMEQAMQQGVPIVNYGMVIAYTKGILKRSLCMFPDLENTIQ